MMMMSGVWESNAITDTTSPKNFIILRYLVAAILV